MKSKDMTVGSILPIMLSFTLFVFIGNLFQQVYNLTDTWVVGKFLEGGITAIGSCNGIYDLMLAFANGMTQGFAIVVSRYFGAHDDEMKRRSIMYTLLMTLSVTFILTIIAVIFMKRFLHILETPDSVFDMAYTYIIVITIGMVTTMLYNMFTALMRSAGNSFVALICLIVAVVLNIGMDVLFVAVFKWGILGVALATVVAQALAAVFCFVFIMIKMPELHISIKDLKWDMKLFKEMALTGLSMGAMLAIVSAGTLIQQRTINEFGEDIITAHTIARKLSSLFMAAVSSVTTSASTFVGQNYGARKFVRIKKGIGWGLVLDLILSVIAFVIVYTAGRYILAGIGSIPPHGNEIIDNAVFYMKINIPFYFILGVLVVFRACMQAVGFKVTPSISSGIELTVKILIAFVIAKHLGYFAICIGEPIIWTLCALMLLITMLVTKKGRMMLMAKEDSMVEELE